MTGPADYPPVVVVSIDTPIGLTVIRELGERGVPVLGVAQSREAIGLYSRWLTRGFVRAPGQPLVDLVREIGERHGARFVLTIAEAVGLTLRRAADAGELGELKILLPPVECLQTVNDKIRTCELAAAEGISVPWSWQPAELTGPADIPADLGFPVVLKWRDPDRIGAALGSAGLALLKAEYCHDRDELWRALARYRPVDAYPMVQGFCPGHGLGQMLFMHGGRTLLRFQHRRLAEWPPEGGFSTVCESLPASANGALLARSEALLRRIGWEGPAMVEYRHDPATGQFALMEINGRFWGSQPLAYHAGAHFAWLSYAVLGLGLNPAPVDYRAGIICRYMIPETKRLLTVLLRTGKIQDRTLKIRPWREIAWYLGLFFHPRSRYFVFSLRDPGPFFGDVWQSLRKLLRLSGG